jgi:hypothetical protein
MKYVKLFKESNEEKQVYYAIMSSADGSGYHNWVGSVKPDEMDALIEFKKTYVYNYKFKGFHFYDAQSLIPLTYNEYSEGYDTIIWIDGYDNILRYNKEKHYFDEVSKSYFSEYINIMVDRPKYKFAALPYFLDPVESDIPKAVLLFEQIENNTVNFNCWKNTNFKEIVDYVKNFKNGWYYSELKELLLKGPHSYKFAKYFDDIPKEDRDKSGDMNNMGYGDDVNRP